MTAARSSTPRRSPTRLYPAIGVATILVLAVLAYISYNALSGLPGQRRMTLYVQVPNADRLQKTDEVRVAGTRVGQVADVVAHADGQRRPYATLKLRLDRSVRPVRSTSTIRVRPGSVLGASYVDLVPGREGDALKDGATLPLSRATRAVQLTDLLDIFERSTARNIQGFLAESSAGVAGRGSDLNATFASLSELLPPLTRVARTLAAPQTRLGPFITAADRAATALAASTPALGRLLAHGATTFDAIVRERPAFAATLAKAPGALAATTRAFTHVQPGLDDLAQLFVDLRPAVALVPGSVQVANATLRAGVPAMRAIPPFSEQLTSTLRSVGSLARTPSTDGAVRKTRELLAAADLTVQVLGPAQQQCNLIGVWGDNFGHVFGDLGVGQGPAIANIGVTTLGADGELLQNAKPSRNVGMNYEAINDGSECESGNEPWDGNQHLSSPAGLQPNTTRDTRPPTGALERARTAGLLDPEPK
jgi:virulence factor Mce-like protein